jgi:hypothetical protein
MIEDMTIRKFAPKTQCCNGGIRAGRAIDDALRPAAGIAARHWAAR